MDTRTHIPDTPTQAPAGGRQIGPVGTVSRLAGGAGFLSLAIEFGQPSLGHWALGGVALPVASVAIMWLLRRGAPSVRWTGLGGYLANIGIGAVVFVLSFSTGMIFYGTAMLLAAARGYAGCEVLAFSNAVLGRDDQVGCPVYSPIDAIEAQADGPGTGT